MKSRAYLFTSERLGFRNWDMSDLALMSAINADSAVMNYFPSVQTSQQTAAFITRMQGQFEARGYCYFAVDRLEDFAFMGFIGICYQDYEADFTPCVDIGWRLAEQFWGNGYATEGSLACLLYALEIGLTDIYAVATVNNLPSISVMKKIGMTYQSTFDHPALQDYPSLKECVLYHINTSRNGTFR